MNAIKKLIKTIKEKPEEILIIIGMLMIATCLAIFSFDIDIIFGIFIIGVVMIIVGYILYDIK